MSKEFGFRRGCDDLWKGVHFGCNENPKSPQIDTSAQTAKFDNLTKSASKAVNATIYPNGVTAQSAKTEWLAARNSFIEEFLKVRAQRRLIKSRA